MLSDDTTGRLAVGMTLVKCEKTPPGWICTRTPGHDGPCAAKEVGLVQGTLESALDAAKVDAPHMSIEQKARALNTVAEIVRAFA